MKRIPTAILLGIIIVLIVSIFGTRLYLDASETEENTFRFVALGQPNLLSHYELAGAKFSAVEVDLMLNSQGTLVAAHGVEDLTKLEKDPSNLASFDRLLELGFDELYLDMKDTLASYSDQGNASLRRQAVKAVEAAATTILKRGRANTIFVMVYRVLPEFDRYRELGIRFMIKGYPKRPDEVMDLVREAAAQQYQGASFELKVLNNEIIRASHQLGIFHVGWTFKVSKEYRRYVEGGLRGIILPIRNLELLKKEMFPQSIG